MQAGGATVVYCITVVVPRLMTVVGTWTVVAMVVATVVTCVNVDKTVVV